MNDLHPRSYSYHRYVHSWPGQTATKSGHKHGNARKQRFKAKHA